MTRRVAQRLASPTTSEAYFDQVSRRMEAESTLQSVRWVEALAHGHDAFRRTACLNLDPNDSTLSRRCRSLLRTELGALGDGGAGAGREPRGCYNEFVEELEATLVAFARRLFGAEHVEWRATGVEAARTALLSALAQPHEVVITLDGGSPDAIGPGHPRTLTVAPTGDFRPDLARLAEVARRVRPRAIVVGGAHVLTPLPMTELRRIADRSGACLVYNADQLGLLISAGAFQRPLEEGADAMIVSTHGAMGGPVGALVLTDDADIAHRLAHAVASGAAPLQDANTYAALAVALAETQTYGSELARRMVRNAWALAEACEAEGLKPLAASRASSATHQIFLNAPGRADELEARCDVANIRLNACALPGDAATGRRSGLRLGVHELTRRGMGEFEMVEVARILAAAMLDADDADGQISAVADLLAPFPTLPFSFDAAQ